MPFRCRQKFKIAKCQNVVEPEQVTLESGEIVTQIKDLGEEKLPDPELFDLKNQIEAGVDMEEVNSKVLKSSHVDAEKIVRKYVKRSNNAETSDNQ